MMHKIANENDVIPKNDKLKPTLWQSWYMHSRLSLSPLARLNKDQNRFSLVQYLIGTPYNLTHFPRPLVCWIRQVPLYLIEETASFNVSAAQLKTMSCGSQFQLDIVQEKNDSGLCWVLQGEIMKDESACTTGLKSTIYHTLTITTPMWFENKSGNL
jgi:hypothetical protein